MAAGCCGSSSCRSEGIYAASSNPLRLQARPRYMGPHSPDTTEVIDFCCSIFRRPSHVWCMKAPVKPPQQKSLKFDHMHGVCTRLSTHSELPDPQISPPVPPGDGSGREGADGGNAGKGTACEVTFSKIRLSLLQQILTAREMHTCTNLGSIQIKSNQIQHAQLGKYA